MRNHAAKLAIIKQLSRQEVHSTAGNCQADEKDKGTFHAKMGSIKDRNCRDLTEADWRRQWHPTPVLLSGKSHGRRSLVGCSPWGREELDTTERLHFRFSLSSLEKEMATHSRVLAWRIPGTGQPGGLLSMGSHRVGPY